MLTTCFSHSRLQRLSGLLLVVFALPGGCRENTGPTSTFAIAWASPRQWGGGDWVNGEPAVDGGRLFVQEGNRLVSLDAATGRRLWARQIRVAPNPGPGTLRAGNGHVYVSETDSLMAIDPRRGRRSGASTRIPGPSRKPRSTAILSIQGSGASLWSTPSLAPRAPCGGR
jgi:outer membrane protein assembly factor BamB